MNLRGFWFPLLCFAAFFFGCSTDPNPNNFNYLRSPTLFRADTTRSDHRFCATSPAIFASVDECSKTKKYVLKWTRPEDTVDFQGYRLYVDTTPPNAPPKSTWEFVRSQSNLSSVIITNMTQQDSLVFIFGKSDPLKASTTFLQDTLGKNNNRIFIIDTTLRQGNLEGRLNFYLVPIFAGQTTSGQPQHSWFIINDNFPPSVFTPHIQPLAKELVITWERPRDATSFFDASLDTGLIQNYHLKITLGGRKTLERQNNFKPTFTYFRGGVAQTKNLRDSILIDAKNLTLGRIFLLPDSGKATRLSATSLDSFKVIVSNLTPKDTLEVLLWAEDRAGNQNSVSMQTFLVRLTDTTQPTQPKFRVDSTFKNQNKLLVQWSASTDMIFDSVTREIKQAEVPNYFIAGYHLQRRLIREIGEKKSKLDLLDTLIQVSGGPKGNAGQNIFVDTMRFLPPGRAFFLALYAVDSSGFASLADTLTLRTDSIQFVGEDTGLVCPPGFLKIPRGNFELGDSASKIDDEKFSRKISMAPYCIEPYEHRDSSGKFLNNMSWTQADSTCKNLALDTAIFGPQICSEAEWERACEGPLKNGEPPLLHGIQSEGTDASILKSTCNQGANDTNMAKSFDLRNGSCVTREGVYDLSGNYNEWVRDAYVATAYRDTSKYKDTLTHDFSYADPTKVRGIRGGNYLLQKSLPTSTVQSLARCSNRDFPQQVRPIFKLACVDTIDAKRPQVALFYAPGKDGYSCIPLPSNLDPAKITDLQPDPANRTLDSTGIIKIFAFQAGKASPDTILLTAKDSVFKGRFPLSAQLTTRSLAVVTFVKPGFASITDTLDATEMRDTSTANLTKIFNRESGQSGYTVKKTGGKFEIKFLYAYAYIGTKPALDYYANRAIAFRCCTRAVKRINPAPLPLVKVTR